MTALSEYKIGQEIPENIPYVKIRHFAAEAKAFDAGRMLQLDVAKLYSDGLFNQC